MAMFLPLLGYLLFIYLWFRGMLIKTEDKLETLFCVDDECKDGHKSLKVINVKRELNLIPMEEALLMNDIHIKRKMMLELIKDNMGKYPEILKMALSNEDSETSHYAATAVVELRRKMTLSLQTWSNRYKMKASEQDVLVNYANVLSESLHSNILDESNYNSVKSIYRVLLKELLDINGLEQKYYIDKISYDIEDGDYLSALFYSERFITAFPRNEEPYMLYLKLYYLLHEKEHFDAILKKLEDTSIVLTKHTWSNISFWRNANIGGI